MLVERYERIMGTRVGAHVVAHEGGEREANDALAACMDWFREVDAHLSRFNAASELSRLNAASGTWQSVSPLLFDALAQSVQAASDSGGLFDPTMLTLIEALGYDRDFAAIRHRESVVEAPGARALWVGERGPVVGGWRAIELDADRRRVRLPFGVRLDLGGIAKGWAADIALERFFSPTQDALINVGGDMRARGGPDADARWPIALGATEQALSADPETLPVVALGAGGLAVSGASDRWWYHNGQRVHHLINPQTARPADLWIDGNDACSAREDAPRIVAATAFAPTAAHAEVAAKVAILEGLPLALRHVECAWAQATDDASQFGCATDEGYNGHSPVALILTLGTGEIACSSNLQDYLTVFGGGGQIWLS
ncbi:MAG TPA: FAD:protein FMN transferase [Ktedonobacterales bacterium]